MKVILLVIMVLGLIISDSRAFEESSFASPAGDKWKVIDITASNKLELGGNDWGFKIKIENKSGVKSIGGSFDITIKIKSGTNVIITRTLTIEAPAINAGKTFTVNFSMDPLVDNQVIEGEFNIIMDTVQEGFTGMTKTFRIKH